MPRTTRTTYACPGEHVVIHKGKPAPIIVELSGDQIAFRHKGGRKRYCMSIPDAMKAAVIHSTKPW